MDNVPRREPVVSWGWDYCLTRPVCGKQDREDPIMAKSMSLGGGGRFEAIRKKAESSGADNPRAVAAAAGIKKYGKRQMAKWSADARKRKM